MTEPPSALPLTQPAAVYKHEGVVEIEARPVPEPAADELLIEVSHCGICGTDLHQVLDGWGIPDSVGGHEFSGVVVATGSTVVGWKAGDRVVGGPEPACGDCRLCHAGRPALCTNLPTPGTEPFNGAFTRYVSVHQDRVIAIPDGLDLRDAALAEPLAVSLHAITRAAVRSHDRIMIFGCGPIGALALAVLVGHGFDDIAIVEPAPVRADLARRLGARHVFDPSELDVPAQLVEPGRIVDTPMDVVLETSGRRDAIESAIAQLDKGGRLVLVGTGLDTPTFDPIRLLLNELSITGAFTYDANGFEEALALLAAGELPVDQLADPQDVALSDMLGAMHRLVAGEVAGKVLVAPGIPQEETP